MLMGILFCVCLVASNLLGTKILQVGPFPLTAGVIVFPVSYILNDCIAEVWGFRKARLIIWMGFLMNFFVVALGGIAAVIPAPPFWEGDEAFRFVFGLAPRIATASLTAFLVGSFLNAWVMSRMKLRHHERRFSLRAHLLPPRLRRADASQRTGQDDGAASDSQDPLRDHRAATDHTSRQVHQAL